MFLTKPTIIKASNDGSGSRPDALDDFWFRDYYPMSTSGVAVNSDSAMRMTTFYACVKLISESLAQLPLVVYRRISDKRKEKAYNYYLYRLLHSQPNKWQTSFEWREMMQANKIIYGNAYSEIITSGNGVITALIPRHPERISIEIMSDNGDYRYIYKNSQGKERIINRGDMMHLRGPCKDGYLGLSVIQVAREAMGEAIAAQNYGISFYKNDAQSPIWIENPHHFRDEDARDNFIKQFKKLQTGSNRFSAPVMENGMKIHSLGVKHTDAQYLEMRQYKDVDLCRLLLVPPHKVGILERATNNNIEHQGIEFVQTCIMPQIKSFEECISRDLIYQEDTYYAKFIVDALMRGDIGTRYEAYASAITTGGWMTRAEARDREDLDEIPGLDKPLVPLNMSGGDQKTDQNKNPRDEAIKLKACERVVNKEIRAMSKSGVTEESIVNFYDSHATYVSEMLALDADTSIKYCECSKNELIQAFRSGRIHAEISAWQKTRAKMLANLKSMEEVL